MNYSNVNWTRNWKGFEIALMAKVKCGIVSNDFRLVNGEVHCYIRQSDYKLAFIEAEDKWDLYGSNLKNSMSVCAAEAVRRACGETWRTSAEFLYCFKDMHLLDSVIGVNLDPSLFWWVPVDRRLVDHPEYWDDEGMDEVDAHHDWWVELV